MNKIVKKAKGIDQFNQYIPDLEVGEIVELNDVWDGEGEEPEESYSYSLGEEPESGCDCWINYVFEVIEKKENPLDTVVKIIDIELL